MNDFQAIFRLIKDTAVGYSRGKGSTWAAAIAYRAIFSLAPLLVISVAVAGWVFGERAVAGELVMQIEGVVGRETAVLLENFVRSARLGSSGVTATIIGIVLLFLGASSLFGQVKIALNQIWGVTSPPRGRGYRSVWAAIRTRLWSFLLVMFIGLLFLATLVISAVLSALDNYLGGLWAGVGNLVSVLDDIVLVGITAVLFAVLFKTLPDAEVAWRDVMLGALVTAVLFGLGEVLIGLYLTRTSVGSTYGAAGSLVVTLLWVYYSAQIFLFGAEFTQVYANKFGSKVRIVAEETALAEAE